MRRCAARAVYTLSLRRNDASHVGAAERQPTWRCRCEHSQRPTACRRNDASPLDARCARTAPPLRKRRRMLAAGASGVAYTVGATVEALSSHRASTRCERNGWARGGCAARAVAVGPPPWRCSSSERRSLLVGARAGRNDRGTLVAQTAPQPWAQPLSRTTARAARRHGAVPLGLIARRPWWALRRRCVRRVDGALAARRAAARAAVRCARRLHAVATS